MEIIDGQIHEPRPWGSWDDAPGKRNELPMEIALAQMDAAGVAAAVWSTRADLGEHACTRFPDRFAWMTSDLDPDDPAIEEKVAKVRARPGCLGLRLVITAPHAPANRARLQAGRYEPLLLAAEKHHVPVCIFVAGEVSLAEPVARAHPGLTLIIDHLGLMKPPLMRPDNPPFRTLPDLIAIAKHPNVGVKFSGMPALSSEPYPFRDLWPHLLPVVRAFGPERLYWGSDIQSVQNRIGQAAGLHAISADYVAHHSYAEAVGYLRDTPELSPGDKGMMFGGTLRRLLRWPPGP